MLFLRSLLWFLLLPGFFAGYLPWAFFGLREVRIDPARPLHWVGLVVIALGVALLVACVVEFALRGRGTLSPVDPPRRLVVEGLYRHVRNPMYLSVSVIVLGEFVLTGSTGLLVYWVVWFACVNLFVMGYEEPTLRGQFGGEYEQYAANVRRWIPRWHPWQGARVASGSE